MRNSINYAGFLDLVIEPNDELQSGESEPLRSHPESQGGVCTKEFVLHNSNVDSCEQ